LPSARCVSFRYCRTKLLQLKQLIAKNIEVERPKMNADSLAELLLTFFTGLSMEQNLSSGRASMVRKIDDLMKIAEDCD
jgi:TetR/AcrR family transcriptional regulator, copper-responsive repressor